MVLPLQWLPEEKDRQWILVWIFCPSLRSISPELEILDLIQYLRQLRWRWGIPGDQCTDQLAFSLCLALDRQSLFRWFNVLLRSCLQHLLFQWWVALGATIAYRFQFWLHLPQWVQDLPRLLLGRVCLLLSQRRMCWTHRLLLRWSCLMAFVHQVGFRVQGNTIPNMQSR
jgi:hypothetical protein